jgi:hypothetical protein
MAVTKATRLGCGQDVDDVWGHVDQPPNEHERACPYCAKARADLAELSAATRELVVADREDPTLRVPDGMLADVLTIVRTEVRRGRTVPLQRSAPRRPAGAATTEDTIDSVDLASKLTVSEQVIAMVVREVCDQNPDVEVRRVSIEATPTPVAPVDAGHGGLEPADLSIDLQATVRTNVAIPAVLSGLRRVIQSEVSRQIGITVSCINIDVVDLFDV